MTAIHALIFVVLVSVIQIGNSVEAQRCANPNRYLYPNCVKECYCFNRTACQDLNGMCPEGVKCDPLYHGPTCDSRRPRLPVAPNVTHDSCREITVSWSQIQGSDLGEDVKNIVKYVLIIKSNGSTKMVNLTANSLSHKLSISQGESYEFCVNTYFMLKSFDIEELGAASDFSEAQSWNCTAAPSISHFDVTAKTTSLNMNWTVKKSPIASAGDVVKVILQWKDIQIGDCHTYSPPLMNGNETSINASSSYTVSTGLFWTLFRVTLTAVDSLGEESTKSKTVLTADRLPNGTVETIEAKDLRETSVVLTWAPPSCVNRGGAFKNYLVNIFDAETMKPVKAGIVLKTGEYNLTGLSPGTTYTASIKFSNSAGFGPQGYFNFTMKGSKPTTTAYTTTEVITTTTAAATTTTPTKSKTTTTTPTTKSPTTTKAATTTTPALSSASTTSVPLVTTTSMVVPNPTAPLEVKATAQAAQLSVKLQWSVRPTTTGVTYKLKSDPDVAGLPQSHPTKAYNVTGLQTRKTYIFSVATVLNGVTSSSWTAAKPVMLLGDSEKVKNLEMPVTQKPKGPLKATFTWGALSGAQDYNFIVNVLQIRPSSRNKNNIDVNVGKVLSHTIALPWAAQVQVTVRARYSDKSINELAPASDPQTFWTAPGPMATDPPPPKPKSKPDKTSAVMDLQPFTSYTDGPLEYYVAVEKVTASRRRRRSVSNADLGLSSSASITHSNLIVVKNPTTVIVGNGSKTSSNPPLEPGTNYTLFFVARSSVPEAKAVVRRFSSIPFETAPEVVAVPGGIPGWIIGVIVLLVILLLLLLFVLICLVLRKRQHRQKNEWDQSLKLTLHSNGTAHGHHHLPATFQHWSEPERVNDARYMVLDPAYGPRDLKVESLRNHHGDADYESFEKEYRSLPWGLDHECNAGRLNANASKNRNGAILPYDHCRVTLDRTGTATPGTDYINASYIDGYLRRRAYIAAQSPFDEATVADFWLMVYQCNVMQIVMLSEIIEEAVMKCTQYWPEPDCTELFGAVQVTCASEEHFAHHSLRTFHILLCGGKVRGAMQTVQQFQFRSWPEHGVPDSPIALLDFYTRVKLRTAQHMGPMVVHCGTGISRTAVFIALDSLLQQAVHENVVNVFKFCNKMRRARPNMIRTAKQYMFLYDLLFEALLATNNIVNLDVRDTLRELMKKNEVTGHSQLWEQHCILEKYTPGPSDSACVAALMAENREKNRLSSVLPSDEHRVRLFSGPASADYINAVFLDSLFATEDVIVTQVPSHHTLTDFWRMLVDHRVTHVVDMEPLHGGREGAVNWMPANKTTAVFGDFSVRAKLDTESSEVVTVRRCVINDSKLTLKVLTLRAGAWDETYSKIPADRSAMVALAFALLKERDAGPIVFLCVDGATRSGLAAVSFLTAQRLYTEHFVDVFHTVRITKQRRRQIIPHLDQYRFLFKFLQDFVRRYMHEQLQREVKTESLYGHLPAGDLESVYSHTQVPVLHTGHGVGAGQGGVHYRYASSELLNTTT